MIESIISIFIISFIFSLTLAAVLSSRASADRMACSSNLRQIGVSLNTFESTNGKYPGVFCGVVKTKTNLTNTVQVVSYSPASQLSSFLGLTSLSQSIQDGSSVDLADLDWKKTHIDSPEVLRCPSDNYASGMAMSYRFNRGVLPLWPSDPGGVFIRHDQGFRASDILDGLSTTAFASERPILEPNGKKFKPSTEIIKLDSNNNSVGQLCYEANRLGVNGTTQFLQSEVGQSWLSGRFVNASYYHFLPPNSHWYDCASEASSTEALINARSYHASGVNVLFGDGSVRFRGNNVSIQLWREEGTRASGINSIK